MVGEPAAFRFLSHLRRHDVVGTCWKNGAASWKRAAAANDSGGASSRALMILFICILND